MKRLENYSLNAVKITGKIYKLIRIVTIRINNSKKHGRESPDLSYHGWGIMFFFTLYGGPLKKVHSSPP